MKTPEEWIKQEFIEEGDTRNVDDPSSFDYLTSCRSMLKLIKQIQHDAWQQGVLDAATHCTQAGLYHLSNQLLAIKDTKKL